MNKLILTLFLTIGISLVAFSQNQYVLIKSIPVSGKQIAGDEMKAGYVANSQNNILKFDSLGNLQSIYSENKYGPISSIDATNPFTVLTFYKEFNTAIALDFNLTAKQLYKFSSAGLTDVGAVCTSQDNLMWVYDRAEHKLKKVNQDYEIVTESEDLLQWLGEGLDPNFMIERGRMIFVNDPEKGVFVFDIFGNYFRSFLIEGLKNFQIIQNKLVCLKDGKLYAYNMQTQSEDVIKLPDDIKNIKDLRVVRNYLLILTDNELKFFKVIPG